MLTCQMFPAVAVVVKIVWMIERYTRRRKGVMVGVVYYYRIADAQVDSDRRAETVACLSQMLEEERPLLSYA